MIKQIDVLTFGDLCADLIITGKDVVPEFGQKEKLVDDYSLQMGGSCSIFACQTGKLALHTAIVGKVGNDRFGDLIINTLKASGVNVEYIKQDNRQKTGLTVALNNVEDRAMLTYNGTNDAVEYGDIPFELLKSVRHLHIGSYFLMKKLQPHYPEIVQKLKSFGATISLDTNWDPEDKWDNGIWDIMPYVDIFLPNENEAMAITKESSADKAIEKLKSIIPILAVKKGKDGAVVYAEGRTIYSPSIDIVKVDAVGAGDSFDGGFVYGYLSGKSLEECACTGCICGSLSTRMEGGSAGQPSLQEINKYL